VDAGTDVLLTTQYLDEADHLASQVVIVDHGRAVATGTPAELKARIGGSVIELHVRAGEDLARVAGLLGRFGRGAVQTDEPTRRVSVRVQTGGEQLAQAMQLVTEAGIELDDIALRQPNLDEVFLALTGSAAANPSDPALQAA
jgi:ABC-2 type transport system ATP-binding protein